VIHCDFQQQHLTRGLVQWFIIHVGPPSKRSSIIRASQGITQFYLPPNRPIYISLIRLSVFITLGRVRGRDPGENLPREFHLCYGFLPSWTSIPVLGFQSKILLRYSYALHDSTIYINISWVLHESNSPDFCSEQIVWWTKEPTPYMSWISFEPTSLIAFSHKSFIELSSILNNMPPPYHVFIIYHLL